MKVIPRYVLSACWTSFVINCSVIVLVMSIGGCFKLTDLLAKGAPLDAVGTLLLLGVPQILVFAIPMSVMTSTMLVFGGLSSNGEITAMRSCGISPWQVISRPALFSVLLVALCLYLANILVPASHYATRLAMNDFLRMRPEAAIDEGRFIEVTPGLSVYVGKKEGTHFKDIKIYDTRERRFTRRIWAKTGYLKSDPEKRTLSLCLQDVGVDPFSRDIKGTAFIETWEVALGVLRGGSPYLKKPVDFSAGEMICAIRNPSDYFPKMDPQTLRAKRTQLVFDLHERVVLALSCLAFTLIGFPLAVRAHRKESSIGMAMSLAAILVFHMFIVAAESFDRHAVLGPLLLWTPIVLGSLLSLRLILRIR